MTAVPLLLIGETHDAIASLRAAAEPLVAAHPSLSHILELPAGPLADDEEKFPPGCVAWAAIGQGFGKSRRFELTAQAQDQHVPLALADLEGPDVTPAMPALNGSIALPIDADATLASAVLGTLASQATTLVHLGRENELLRAHHGGMAEQIGRIDEELRMAVKIQREFLPKALPDIGDFGFEVLWRPAGYVSGDIYDVIRLDEHHFGFFMADAVGHGVPAALMTIYIKQSLRTKRIEPNAERGYRLLEPRETMTYLNRALLEQDGGSTCFATAVYGVVDARTGQTTMARAGHPLPRLLHADGSTEPLDGDGPMLGVFDTDEFNQHTFVLKPGDRLLLFSDGFEMAFPEDAADAKNLANEKYIEAFEGLRDRGVADAFNAFRRDLDSQCGSLNQRDDLTLLCVHAPADAKLEPVPDATPISDAVAA
ncbi:MAG: SpoIIE family protein phosphatase [Planctomycetota bacterium]